MKQTAGSAASPCQPGTVLSIGPIEGDQHFLERILSAFRYTQADISAPVVICERDLAPGTWKDMLRRPCVIVTSRLANHVAVNDVLARSGDRKAVIRIMSPAALRMVKQSWKLQREGSEGKWIGVTGPKPGA